jgi:hypothetical protein
LIFVFLTATFYSFLAARGLPVNDESFRNDVSPLNTPPVESLVAVVREASTGSFHLAMLIGAGLLLAGAIVNAVGIRNRAERQAEEGVAEPASATPA